MASFINTNISSLTAQRNLNTSEAGLNSALQRLSSGLRINSAKDDAAGLSISTRMSSQIGGLDQAARNANDGISLAQTAEGALGQVTANLQRIRDLAVQAANGSNSLGDRQALNSEAAQLVSEITRVATLTQFNGLNLIDGSFSGQQFQVGANANQTIAVSSIVNAQASALGVAAQALHAEDDGLIQADTTGSAISGRIAVYAGFHDIGDLPIACGPPGNPSIAKFSAKKGTNYTIEVDGQAGGNIQLTCKMGIAPVITNGPKYCLVAAGGSISLSMPATNWCPLPVCQWRFNGQNMAGAIKSTLLLTNFSGSQTGLYSVVMSNFVRVATNSVAYLDLAGPFVLSYALAADNGKTAFVITASNATPFVLQTTTDLGTTWLPVKTNQDPCLTLVFTNVNMLLEPRRFFRAIPWP